MKSMLRRISALLIAAIMVVAMCVPVMAQTTTVKTNIPSPGYPTENDKGTVTVSGFTKGQVESVIAYQIVDAEYNVDGQTGFSGYVAVKDQLREAVDPEAKKSDRIPIFGDVAKKNDAGLTEYSYKDGEDTVTVYSEDGNSFVDAEGNAATIPTGVTPEIVTEFIAVYPKSSELSLLAEDNTILVNGVTMTSEDGISYTAELPVGEWMVIATPAAGSDTVYNPMLVSVYYVVDEDGHEQVAHDSISSTDNWDGKLEVKDAYIKSSRPTVEKTILKNSRESIEGETTVNSTAQDSAHHGDDHAFNDTVDFQAKTMIPSYSDEYLAFVQEVDRAKKAGQSYTTDITPIKFDITDTMEPGLSYDTTKGLEIIIGEEVYDDNGELIAPAERYTLSGKDKIIKYNTITQGETTISTPMFTYTVIKSNVEGGGKIYGYKISFAENYILEHDNWPVTVRYSAKLNDKATVNYDANENTVDVTYTLGHNPETNGDGSYKTRVKYDENGNPVPKTDDQGNPIPKEDDQGNPVLRVDEDGNPIPVLDEDGNPVPKTDDQGNPIPKTDDQGNPVLDKDGEPVYEYEYEVEYEYEEEVDIPENDLEDTTYHYTFEIDGDVFGDETDNEQVPKDPLEYENRTHELLKLNEKGDVEKEAKAADDGTTSTKTLTNPLAGAYFSLTRTDKFAKADDVYYAVSDTNGHFGAGNKIDKTNEVEINGTKHAVNGFKGLDAGVYELKEEKAPAGYTLNKATYTVIIEAEYYSETGESSIKGMLKEYTITVINDKDFTASELEGIKNGTTKAADINSGKKNETTHVATYTCTKVPAEKAGQEDTYVLQNTEVADKIGDALAQASTFIKNTKLTDLPSTGGIGSYLFTIIGVAVMAVVAGSYFRSRAKRA